MLKRIVELVVNTALLVWAHAVWGLALLLAWGGYAFAQGAEPFPAIDPTGWGGSPFAFGAFLTLVTAAIKRAVEGWKLERYGHITSNPWLWRGVVLALALVGAFGLNIAKYGAELVLFGLVSPWTVLLFALASALVAMGYRDLLKSALSWIGGPRLPGTVLVQQPASTEPAPPSGFEPLNLTLSDSATPSRGLMSVPSFPGMGGPLVEAGLSALLTWVLTQLHLPPTAENIARLALKLGKVLPDLAFDGDAHLSWRNRADILDVAEELKAMGGLK